MDFSKQKNITIFSHPLIKHKISLLRDKEASTNKFRTLIEEIAMLEDYCLMWRIGAGQWKKEWTDNPKGFVK